MPANNKVVIKLYSEPKVEFYNRTLLLKLEQREMIGESFFLRRGWYDNLRFKCSGMSINHGEMYSNGKFYLKDNGSTFGTYVNNSRLSLKEEESEPFEIYSRDKIQFGSESSYHFDEGDRFVTATLLLFLPDGREVKRNLGNRVNLNYVAFYKLQHAKRRLFDEDSD